MADMSGRGPADTEGQAAPDLVVAIGAKDKGQGDMGNLDCVPLSALRMPDETEQLQSPEIGDKVQYVVEGCVKKITGDNAYVERETINGQPAEDNKEPTPTDPQYQSDDGQVARGDDYSALENAAQGMQLQ